MQPDRPSLPPARLPGPKRDALLRAAQLLRLNSTANIVKGPPRYATPCHCTPLPMSLLASSPVLVVVIVVVQQQGRQRQLEQQGNNGSESNNSSSNRSRSSRKSMSREPPTSAAAPPHVHRPRRWLLLLSLPVVGDEILTPLPPASSSSHPYANLSPLVSPRRPLLLLPLSRLSLVVARPSPRPAHNVFYSKPASLLHLTKGGGRGAGSLRLEEQQVEKGSVVGCSPRLSSYTCSFHPSFNIQLVFSFSFFSFTVGGGRDGAGRGGTRRTKSLTIMIYRGASRLR
ncbi:hypothetical protein E2C01_050347 [Portunus trituberculatus]|uniref:Uncharacterized protein n=1 Tax=Portunus trituberculatus TaxID=210409 RepID=A0A5B7GGI4_PORTR|nr:hypothetical protein [Portunus trituberculatus]